MEHADRKVRCFRVNFMDAHAHGTGTMHKTFGLILSADSPALRQQAAALLEALDIPLSGFVAEPAAMFHGTENRAAFLRKASAALMMPGVPLPAAGVVAHLQGDARPGNVLRRYVFLQLSLLPYLRPGRAIVQGNGCFLVGEDLLVAPVSAEDTVDALLPPGTWTELTGATHSGRLREMRGFNEMPVLVRENALLPIGVNDRSTFHDDADRVTLHWFQPQEKAACILADGTRYDVKRVGQCVDVHTDTEKAFHLILHEDGAERLIR